MPGEGNFHKSSSRNCTCKHILVEVQAEVREALGEGGDEVEVMEEREDGALAKGDREEGREEEDGEEEEGEEEGVGEVRVGMVGMVGLGQTQVAHW